MQDQIAAGQKKALIVMGHVVSEQSGIRYCAEWLTTFVPETPVEFVAAPNDGRYSGETTSMPK